MNKIELISERCRANEYCKTGFLKRKQRYKYVNCSKILAQEISKKNTQHIKMICQLHCLFVGLGNGGRY